MIALRPVTSAVARAVVEHLPVPVEHVPDWPHEDTADAFRPLAEHPDDTGEGTFLVLEDGVVVGDCGWFGPPVDGVVDIGYGLAPSARGRGVGTEAVRQLLDWVGHRGAVQARAEVLPGNAASVWRLPGRGSPAPGARAGHRVLVREVNHTR